MALLSAQPARACGAFPPALIDSVSLHPQLGAHVLDCCCMQSCWFGIVNCGTVRIKIA